MYVYPLTVIYDYEFVKFSLNNFVELFRGQAQCLPKYATVSNA